MKYLKSILIIALLWGAGILSCVTAQETHSSRSQWKTLKGDIALFMCNDMGRNGYYDQKPIAELMGSMAETVGPEAVIACGDTHHFQGVASVNDPLWLTNYEHIYSHPELMLPWLPALGNHEYCGSTQAVLDYSNVSRRWQMPARYYTQRFEHKGATLRLIILDTTPMIDKYRDNAGGYPDAARQDVEAQLAWLDKTLSEATEQWVIVCGHHPIYAQTPKAEKERTDMQRRLLPVLHKHKNVAAYLSGHIHNFQHIRRDGDPIDYVVNSAAALSRPVEPTAGTQFCSPETGFSVITATRQVLVVSMIDKRGNVIYQLRR